MNALLKVKNAGFRVELENERLFIEPFSKLKPNQLEFLKAHKAEIIEELKHEQVANSAHVLTVLDKKIILAWLNHIGEQDPEMINDVLTQCANNQEALAYYLSRSLEITTPLFDLFDDRHYCRECQNLNWQGRCTVSKTRYTPVDTHPRRCADFVERGVKND